VRLAVHPHCVAFLLCTPVLHPFCALLLCTPSEQSPPQEQRGQQAEQASSGGDSN
jgi:hypothetical protein